MKTIVSSKSRIRQLYKPWYQRLRYSQNEKKIIFIFGCMRSGTTLLSHIFDAMPFTDVYGEYSALSAQDPYRLRWTSLDDAQAILSESPAPLIVCKPLVESQHASALLDYFPNSSAIWLYRHYEDVAASNIVKFGEMEGAINNIRPVVDPDFARNPWTSWLTENVSEESRELLHRYFSLSMKPADAAVLFWYLRNVLFFEQNLTTHDRCEVICYEDFVNAPAQQLTKFFKMAEIDLPLYPSFFRDVHTGSVKKGKALNLTPEIRDLSDTLLHALHKVKIG